MTHLLEYMTPLEKVLISEIVEVSKLAYSRGWLVGTSGNFSLRFRPSIVWQSPSGVSKNKLSVESFIPVELESSKVLTSLKLKPSEEMPIHLAIYRNSSDARCVVHAHTPNVIKMSRKVGANQTLSFHGQEMQKALGCKTFKETLEIPIFSNQDVESIEDFSRTLSTSHCSQSQMVILEEHGAYVWGHDAASAFNRLESIEFLCESVLG